MLISKIKFIIFWVGLIFLLNACKNSNINTENTLIMEIDGVRYETQEVNTTVIRAGSLFSVEIIASFPNKKDRIFLKIYSFSQQGAGTYLLGGLEQNQMIYAQDGNFVGSAAIKTDVSCIASQGNFIQITDFDGQILNGNFSGTLCRGGTSKNITNGQLLRLYVR